MLHLRRLKVRFSLAQLHLILNRREPLDDFVQPQRHGVNGSHVFPAMVRQGLLGKQNQVGVAEKRSERVDHPGTSFQQGFPENAKAPLRKICDFSFARALLRRFPAQVFRPPEKTKSWSIRDIPEAAASRRARREPYPSFAGRPPRKPRIRDARPDPREALCASRKGPTTTIS